MKKSKSQDGSIKNSSSVKAVLYGLGGFAAVVLVLTAILAVLNMYTEISGGTTHILYITILLAASLIGGFSTGRKCSRKGLMHGFVLGVVIWLLILLYTVATGDISPYEAVIKFLVITVAASLGGVIGIK